MTNHKANWRTIIIDGWQEHLQPEQIINNLNTAGYTITHDDLITILEMIEYTYQLEHNAIPVH